MDCLRSLSCIGERPSCRRLVSLEHNPFPETSLSRIRSLLLLFRSTIGAENRDILLFEVVCMTLRWEGDFNDRMGLVPDIFCEVEDLYLAPLSIGWWCAEH